MRTLLFINCLLWTTTLTVAQSTTPVTSSASDWSVVVITPRDTVATTAGPVASKRKTSRTKAKTLPAVAPSEATAERPSRTTNVSAPEKATVASSLPGRTTSATRSFLETFADNRNGWLTGRRNGFELEIADDNSYYIRSQRAVGTGQHLNRPGRSYIKLPEAFNLNQADTFTVSVEMVIPAGTTPDAGLLVGVKDTSNYCQFRLLDKNKVALYTRVNGVSQSNYMTGKPTLAKVPIDSKRNTLTIRRTGEQLHFYINGREVEDSPHPYRPFRGNGVGFISYANAVKFQYLTVQVGK